MNNEYKIFRVFCVLSVALLCVLLLTTGVLTAKYQTEQTVFGTEKEVVQIFRNESGAVFNLGGSIGGVDFDRVFKGFDFLSHTVFAPFGNITELIREIGAAVLNKD